MLIVPVLIESAFSQTPAQKNTPGSVVNEITPEVVVPKRVSNVEVTDNLLSVELVDAEFGVVMNSISQKSDIKVEIVGDTYNRKLTTKFSGMELERGILRLLTLVKEKNYLIHYDAKGLVSRIEVYGGAPAAASTSRPQTTVRPQVQRPAAPSGIPPVSAPAAQTPTVVQKNPPPFKRILSPVRDKKQEGRMQSQPKTPQITKEKEYPDDEDEDEDSIDEIPYVPPQKSPPSVLPKTQ